MDRTASKLLRQQAAIAAFGSFALRESDLLKILTEAARVCAEGLNVPFCKVCRFRPVENDLLVEAGYGWQAGVVGHVVSAADESSPQGRAFITGEPSVCHDLTKGNYLLPAFYAAHGIISTIDVVIRGTNPSFGMPRRDREKAQDANRAYGVQEIDNNEPHDYDQYDIDFLTVYANVLAAAVATAARTAMLQSTIDQMRVLVEEKDRLLGQKKVLAAELQHRVRNNLQLIYGMLSKQLDDTTDQSGQRGIKSIGLRVTALAQVYDHLLGTEMTRTTDFGSYVKALCQNLASIQAASRAITLACDSEPVILDLDTVTALGIVVAELVTNCYEHGFPGDAGSIRVSVRHDPAGNAATMTVTDDGHGFEPGAESKRQGIGLVRRLVEQVRGTATITSDQGGTVWTIKFPALPPEPSRV